MAKKLKEKKKDEAKQDEVKQDPQPEKQEKEQKEKPEPPKERHLLLSILTVLLVLVGIGELGALGLCGFHLYRGMLVKQQYEARMTGEGTGPAQIASTVSYGGPGLKIENGVVVWQREEELPAGGVSGSGVDATQGSGQSERIVYSQFSVPVIHYRLAEDAQRERLAAGQPVGS